jgi:hypothetical protein
MQRVGELGRDRLHADAEPSAHHRLTLLELRQDLLRHVDRHREADRVRLRIDRRVDADDFTREVEQRPARVAGIDRRVGLDEVVVRTLSDVAAGGAHDPGRDGVIEPERVADRHHPVAGQELVGITERERRVLALLLRAHERDVGLRIAADHLRVGMGAVDEHDLDLLDLIDDVVIGDDQAVFRDHEARPEARHGEAARLGRLELPARTAGIPEPALEQSAEQIAERTEVGHLLHHGLRGVNVDDSGRDRAREDREARVGAFAADLGFGQPAGAQLGVIGSLGRLGARRAREARERGRRGYGAREREREPRAAAHREPAQNSAPTSRSHVPILLERPRSPRACFTPNAPARVI